MSSGAVEEVPRRNALIDGAKARQILRLAAPVILAMLTQTGVNVVDTYFVGQLPREVAVDGQFALTPSLMFLWAVGGFLSAISVGTLSTTARRFGEQRLEDAGAVLPNAVVLALVGGALGTVVGWIFLPDAFRLLTDNPNVVRLGTGYARWRFVGIASMAATAAFKSWYDGIGRTHLHLVAAVAMNVVNGLLCYVLIFGRWGFPRMEMEGAGLAACASSWIGMLVMVLFTLRPADLRAYRFYRAAALSWTTMRNLLRLSVPGGIATSVVMSGFLLFTKVVGRIDDAAIAAGAARSFNGAATTIIVEVLSMVFVTSLAFGTATAAMVGQSLGRGQPEEAERYGWTSVKLGALVFGSIGLWMATHTSRVLGAFSHEPAVVVAGATPMMIMGGLGAVLSTALILTQALFGAGDTRFVMVVELGLHFTCLVPLGYVLGIVLGFGLNGAWAAVAIYGVALASLMVWRFAGGSWKKLTV